MLTSLATQQQYLPLRLPLHIGTWSFNSSYIWFPTNQNAALASTTWPANNRALYAPIYLPGIFTVARFIVLNGSNATGNVDVGLYNNQGAKLISTGTTGRSGTNVVQYIGVTDQAFPPGAYYLALVGSSTTGQYMRTTANSIFSPQIGGYLLEDLGATTLPVNMAPSAYGSTSAFHWGFSQSDTL